MNQATDARTTKSKKVTILSDIILNPLHSPPRSGIIPLPSVTLVAPLEHNKPTEKFAHLTNSNIKNKVTLKRKSETGLITIVPAIEESKKPRTQENSEETVFNYMTGTYEKVIGVKSSGSLEYNIQKFADTKDEIKIEETSLLNENITLLDVNDEKQLAEKVELDKDITKTNLATTPTIDLTDDEPEPSFIVNKNFFVENVLALQNAVELQALANEKSDVKFPLQNVVISNTVQEKVIAKNTIIQKSRNIGKVITSNEQRVAEKATASLISPNLFAISGSAVEVQSLKQNSNNQTSHILNIPRLIIPKQIPKLGAQNKALLVPKKVTAKTFWPGQSPTIRTDMLWESSEPLQNLQPKGTQNSIPLHTNSIPFDTNSVPLNTNSIPLNTNAIPLNTNSIPLNTNSIPLNTNSIPLNRNSIPLNTNSIPLNTQTITKSIIPSQNSSNLVILSLPPNSLQGSVINLQNLNCHTCAYKGQSKRDLTFHIYDVHLKHIFEQKLVCKLCNFETTLLSVMEKHDLGHGNTEQEKVKDFLLSSYVEIKVRKKEPIKTSTSEIDKIKSNSSIETIELIDSDDEAPPNNSKETYRYRCFDCNYYNTSEIKLLQKHAVRQHPTSKFECPKHPKLSPNCLECDYKKCLLDSEENMFQCGKCGYRTHKLKCFSIHIDEKLGGCAKEYLFSSDSESQDDNSLQLKCFHCLFDTFSIQSLKNHARAHFGEAFKCDLHLSRAYSKCNKCIYEAILKDLAKSSCGGEENGQKLSKPDVAKDNLGKNIVSSKKKSTPVSTRSAKTSKVVGYKCFHCSFVGKNRFLLKTHTVKHYKQNFQCDIHPNVNSETCKKCVYKKFLLEVNEEVFSCPNCTFKTLSQNNYDKHRSNEENCENFKIISVRRESLLKNDSNVYSNGNDHNTNILSHNKEMLNFPKNKAENCQLQESTLKEKKMLHCLDCNNFKAKDRDKLKKHATKHHNTNFYCDKHLATENMIDCEKCLYLCIKNEIQKEILVCKNCSFYTLDKNMFNRHSLRKQSCTLYRRKVEGIDGVYVPESNIGSNFSEEENELKKYICQKPADTNKTIYNFKCYDCDLQYMDRSAFEEHVKSHKNSSFRCEHPIFTKHCMKCLYQSILEKTLGKKALICKYCKYHCNDLESLQNHLKANLRCQGLNVKAKKSKVFKCYDCNKELYSKLHLWNHSFLHMSHYKCVEHKTDININGCDKCFYAYIQKNIHIRKHNCFECNDQVLRSEIELKGHVEVRHRNSNFTCDLHRDRFVEQCDKCFYKYICCKTSKRPVIVCAICNNNFNYDLYSWSDLQTHIKNEHAGNDSIVNCPDHIIENQFLNCAQCLFVKIVNDMRCDLYQCHDCNLRLSSKDKLEVHVRIMHEHSTFQCTKHDLGDIVEKCGMCIYESIVVRMKSII